MERIGKKVKRLYIHCSVSTWGNENVINHWHRARRFLTMVRGYHLSTGYNYVVLNEKPHDGKHCYPFLDGQIETARPDWITTAAVRRDNRDTVHVCLIGMPGEFTPKQIEAAYRICAHYILRQGLELGDILGHYEYWLLRGEQPLKACPGINMHNFRNDLSNWLRGGGVKPAVKVTPHVRKTFLDTLNILLGGGQVKS